MQFRIKDQVIPVNMPDRDALLAAVAARWRVRQGFALATINLDHLVKLYRLARFRAAYAAQDLVVADGNPIVWLSRLARRPVALVPGSDLVVPLAELAAREGVSVALVGSTAAVLDGAAQELQRQVPGLRIAARLAPPMGFDARSPAAAELLEEVADSGARLCFLALGAPRQEELAARGRQVAPSVGFAAVGAGLDFLTGAQQRAPEWVRRLALEWLWRMLTSPRRLVPRYTACAAILPAEVAKALALRQQGPAPEQPH